MLNIELEVSGQEPVDVSVEEHVGGTGEADYNRLINKPFLNGRELKGDYVLNSEDIGINYADNFDIENMFN